MASLVYERRRPETSTLYHVVQENLDTLYGAVEDGALAIALPKFVRKELEGYLECGLLCHGFARLKSGSCDETRLVAFSCKRPVIHADEPRAVGVVDGPDERRAASLSRPYLDEDAPAQAAGEPRVPASLVLGKPTVEPLHASRGTLARSAPVSRLSRKAPPCLARLRVRRAQMAQNCGGLTQQLRAKSVAHRRRERAEQVPNATQ